MQDQSWKYDILIGGLLVAILGLVLFMVPKAEAATLFTLDEQNVGLGGANSGEATNIWSSTNTDIELHSGSALTEIIVNFAGMDNSGTAPCTNSATIDVWLEMGSATSSVESYTCSATSTGNFVFASSPTITETSSIDVLWNNRVLNGGQLATIRFYNSGTVNGDGISFVFDYPGDGGNIYNSTHFTIAFPDDGLIPLATSTAFFGASFSLSSSSVLQPPSMSDDGISGEEEPGVISSRVNCFLNTGNEFCVNRNATTSTGFPGEPVYKARFPFDPWEFVAHNTSTIVYARPWYRYQVGSSWTYRIGPSISFTVKSGGTNANTQDAYHIWVGEKATTYDDSSWACTPAADWTDIGGGIRYGGCTLGQSFLKPDPLFTNKIENQFNDLKQMFPFSIATAMQGVIESSSISAVGNSDIILTMFDSSFPLITSSTMPNLLTDDTWYWYTTENIIHVVAFLTLFALIL